MAKLQQILECQFCGDPSPADELDEGKCKSCQEEDKKYYAEMMAPILAEVAKATFELKEVTFTVKDGAHTLKQKAWCWKGLCYHNVLVEIIEGEDGSTELDRRDKQLMDSFNITGITSGLRMPFYFGTEMQAKLFIVRAAELTDWLTVDPVNLGKEIVTELHNIRFSVFGDLPPEEW